ncbi:MAG: energy-coupling factor transporter ATPase [Candidatus Anoxymicrobium japonicum]|uniref:Energy-coupling factor transporter ATPase n=1 Tax=Candidatus Anoxymicrobium japonicum TaxID=2013648 RepID=A0A2N3G7C6_9ACTN|nr:MAG: energy-coupling factor transporter ATPase [Candidatus Anoxymicrobium japonicum]
MALRLRLEDVSFSYPLPARDEAPALNSVSLTLEPGDALCLAGANGSGKSTLAQVCAGLLTPSAGSLFYGGKRVKSHSSLLEFRRACGLLFQNPEDQLFADTVEKDIAFGPRNHGLRGEDLRLRIRESCRLVDLSPDEIGERSPFSLSGGEQRRVALAGVLALEPEVLVLDEPFIGLDYEGRQSLQAALKRYHEEREASIIVVTHELSHMWSLATNFSLMSEGRITRSRTRAQLLKGDTDLGALGMRLPQWESIARELMRHGVSIDDRADPRSLAAAIAKYREVSP